MIRIIESLWSDVVRVTVLGELIPFLGAPNLLEPDEGVVVIQRSMMRLSSFAIENPLEGDGFDKTDWEVYALPNIESDLVAFGSVDGEAFQIPLEIGAPAIRPIELYLPKEGEILNNRSIFILSPVEFVNQLDDGLEVLEFEFYEGSPDEFVLVDNGTTTTSAFRLNNISEYGI